MERGRGACRQDETSGRGVPCPAGVRGRRGIAGTSTCCVRERRSSGIRRRRRPPRAGSRRGGPCPLRAAENGYPVRGDAEVLHVIRELAIEGGDRVVSVSRSDGGSCGGAELAVLPPRLRASAPPREQRHL